MEVSVFIEVSTDSLPLVSAVSRVHVSEARGIKGGSSGSSSRRDAESSEYD